MNTQDTGNMGNFPYLPEHMIITHSNTDNLWDLLFILLTKQCPFLSEKSMDVTSEIALLHLNNDDTIHTFYHVQDIQTKLQ